VDHVAPHHNDEQAFFFGPIQSLCGPCHAAKSHAERGHVRRWAIGLDGCPIEENFIDADDDDLDDDLSP
jgi:hypothetical protein